MRQKRTWERSHFKRDEWILCRSLSAFPFLEYTSKTRRATDGHLSRHDVASFSVRTLQDWRGHTQCLYCEQLAGEETGVPYTLKGILVINIALNVLLCPTWKPLKTSYTVVWFHLKNCASQNVLRNLSSAFKLFLSFRREDCQSSFVSCWTQYRIHWLRIFFFKLVHTK